MQPVRGKNLNALSLLAVAMYRIIWWQCIDQLSNFKSLRSFCSSSECLFPIYFRVRFRVVNPYRSENVGQCVIFFVTRTRTVLTGCYTSFSLTEQNHFQGCALAEPRGPWRLTFALGRLENLTFFIQIICWET